MSVARALGCLAPGVLLLAVLWLPLLLRRAGRRSVRVPNALVAWRSMSPEAQRAHDNAVLNGSEAAQLVLAKNNALYHP